MDDWEYWLIYVKELDRIGVRRRRKYCAVRPQEEGRYAVSKINRAVSMKIVMEDSKRCNILAKRTLNGT